MPCSRRLFWCAGCCYLWSNWPTSRTSLCARYSRALDCRVWGSCRYCRHLPRARSQGLSDPRKPPPGWMPSGLAISRALWFRVPSVSWRSVRPRVTCAGDGCFAHTCEVLLLRRADDPAGETGCFECDNRISSSVMSISIFRIHLFSQPRSAVPRVHGVDGKRSRAPTKPVKIEIRITKQATLL